MITLSFCGKTIRLANLCSLLKTYPLIEVKASELAKEDRYAFREGKNEAPQEADQEEISVFRFEGHYIVLTGQAKLEKTLAADKAVFKARFVTKQALKHIQTIEQPAPAYPAYEPPPPRFHNREYSSERRPYAPNAMQEAFNKR